MVTRTDGVAIACVPVVLGVLNDTYVPNAPKVADVVLIPACTAVTPVFPIPTTPHTRYSPAGNEIEPTFVAVFVGIVIITKFVATY